MARPATGPHSGRHIRRPRPEQVARFWSRVQKGDGCWVWVGQVNKRTGYGVCSLTDQHRSPIHAHRVSYAIAHGSCPGGRVIMHSCDNTICVNPAHLRSATQRQNIQDAIRKGRKAATPTVAACRRCESPRDLSLRVALCRKCYIEKEAQKRDCVRVERLRTRHQRLPEGLPDTYESLVAAIGDERRARFLARNFGLYHFSGAGPQTLTAVAGEVGLSRERVRQIVSKACERLGVTPRTFFGGKAA